MTNYRELIPAPPPSDINTGLSPCHQSTMLDLFGRPGDLTTDCSAVTNKLLKSQLKVHKFNNFTVEGWGPAVDSLVVVLTEVYHEKPDLHAVVGTAGMLCCRRVRGGKGFSNHSWGLPVDITIGGELLPQGSHQVQRGLLELYPFFHRHGWYWGLEFPTPDGMHFEPADETLRRLFKEANG